MWTCPHQVLAATLTLYQPSGKIEPTLYIVLVSTRYGKQGVDHMKRAPILKVMGKIDAHSLRIKMMASYIHYLATNRWTDPLNQKENMSNIQILSTDLCLYHQKALYN